MNEYKWPYPGIPKTEFLAQIALTEKILQKYGAEYIKDSYEKNIWILNDGSYACETARQHIWKLGNEYIRANGVYFPDKPFIVLEFSKNKEGPYEDADPFPYDLPYARLKQETRYSLGIETI